MAPEHSYHLDMSNNAASQTLAYLCDQLQDLMKEAGTMLLGASSDELRAIFNASIDHFDKLEDELCRLNQLLCEQKLVSTHVEGEGAWIERVLDVDSTFFVPTYCRGSHVGARPVQDSDLVDLSQAYSMLHMRAQNLFRGMIYPDEDPRMYKELAKHLEAQQEKQRLLAEEVRKQAAEAFIREHHEGDAAVLPEGNCSSSSYDAV